MNELRTNQPTISSLEVAEMMGVKHYNLLKKIEGSGKNIGVLQVLSSQVEIHAADYFIGSEYLDNQKKPRKCYEITKKGCDMLAHKMTGEKGIIFTARYIEKFYELEQEVSNKVPQTYAEALLEAGRLALDNEKKQKQLEEKQAVINHQEEKIDRLTVNNSKLQEENDRMQATCAMPRKHVVKDIRSFKNQFLKDSVGNATHRNDMYRYYIRTRWNRDVQPPISMFEDIMYSLGFRISGDYWVDTIVLTDKIR